MRDVQAERDVRQVSVQRVGIKDIQLPVHISDKEGQRQCVVATIALSVDLTHEHKGTHMSRFVELLEQWREQPWSGDRIEHLLVELSQCWLQHHEQVLRSSVHTINRYRSATGHVHNLYGTAAWRRRLPTSVRTTRNSSSIICGR